MASFLTSPTNFRLLGFNIGSDCSEDDLPIERGIISVVNRTQPDAMDPNFVDPLLSKLKTIPRFVPLKPRPSASRYLWGSGSPNPWLDSKLDIRDDGPEAILNLCNAQLCHHFHSKIRDLTQDQAQLIANIKNVESVAFNAGKQAYQMKKELNSRQDRLLASVSLLHQEVAKTRYHLGEVFSSIAKARANLDALLDEEGEVGDRAELELGLDIDSNLYPNLYKLTYHQRSSRPQSYHPQLCPSPSTSPKVGFRPRGSLDLPGDGRSWGFSKSRNLPPMSGTTKQHHNNNKDENSQSLLASAISKVQFATSKAYRHRPPPSEAMTPCDSGSSTASLVSDLPNSTNPVSSSAPTDSILSLDSKRKPFSLRSTLSLANLKSLRKQSPKLPDKPNGYQPLNAKDRLSQIASASPRPSTPSQLSKWLPAMFKAVEHSPVPRPERHKRSPSLNDGMPTIRTEDENSPTIPKLIPSPLIRSFSASASIPRVKRRPSLRTFLLEHPSMSSPVPLSSELADH